MPDDVRREIIALASELAGNIPAADERRARNAERHASSPVPRSLRLLANFAKVVLKARRYPGQSSRTITISTEGTMAIIGTHALLYTSEPEKLRAVLRDGFDFKCVDAGQGWLIFSLPPAELGVHPAEEPM